MERYKLDCTGNACRRVIIQKVVVAEVVGIVGTPCSSPNQMVLVSRGNFEQEAEILELGPL